MFYYQRMKFFEFFRGKKEERPKEEKLQEEPRNQEKVFQELEQILHRATYVDEEYSEKKAKIHDKIATFCMKLEVEHPGILKYLLYHLLLAGNMPDVRDYSEFDLPNHEIENFIRGLEK